MGSEGVADTLIRDLLEEMRHRSEFIHGPLKFQLFAKQKGYKGLNTVTYIAIDKLEKVFQILKSNNAMVFRVGGGSFVLIRFEEAEDFKRLFLIDNDIFSNTGFILLPNTGFKYLYLYHLLPNLSESSLVGLAMSAGVFNRALDLDASQLLPTPFTTQGTFTFPLHFHTKIDQGKLYQHQNGQVEIDGLFLGTKKDKEKLYVIEAKKILGLSHAESSIAPRLELRVGTGLSKHKLLYSVLAVASFIPPGIEIVPVYLKIIDSPGWLHFLVAECSYDDPRRAEGTLSPAPIDSIRPVNCSHLYLPKLSTKII